MIAFKLTSKDMEIFSKDTANILADVENSIENDLIDDEKIKHLIQFACHCIKHDLNTFLDLNYLKDNINLESYSNNPTLIISHYLQYLMTLLYDLPSRKKLLLELLQNEECFDKFAENNVLWHDNNDETILSLADKNNYSELISAVITAFERTMLRILNEADFIYDNDSVDTFQLMNEQRKCEKTLQAFCLQNFAQDQTLLHLAIRTENLETIKQVIRFYRRVQQSGSKLVTLREMLESVDKNRNTPLNLAAELRNTSICQYLVSVGAEPSTKNIHGLSVIDNLEPQNMDILTDELNRQLINKKRGRELHEEAKALDQDSNSKLINAIEARNVREVNHILESTRKHSSMPSYLQYVNHYNNTGSTALHLAVISQYYNLVETLIFNTKEITSNAPQYLMNFLNFTNADGKKALELAFDHGRSSIIKIILQTYYDVFFMVLNSDNQNKNNISQETRNNLMELQLAINDGDYINNQDPLRRILQKCHNDYENNVHTAQIKNINIYEPPKQKMMFVNPHHEEAMQHYESFLREKAIESSNKASLDHEAALRAKLLARKEQKGGFFKSSSCVAAEKPLAKEEHITKKSKHR